jgi:hypothetical protein
LRPEPVSRLGHSATIDFRKEFPMLNLISELEIEARHADNMAAMAEMWMKRALDAERLIPLLVHSAGGTIKVDEFDLMRRREFVLERWNCPYDMTIVFRASGMEARRAATDQRGKPAS